MADKQDEPRKQKGLAKLSDIQLAPGGLSKAEEREQLERLLREGNKGLAKLAFPIRSTQDATRTRIRRLRDNDR